MSMAESLSDALPDLVVLVRRDGVIMDLVGGGAVAALASRRPMPAGARLDAVWPEAAALPVMHAMRRASPSARPVDTTFESDDVPTSCAPRARTRSGAVRDSRALAGGLAVGRGGAVRRARPAAIRPARIPEPLPRHLVAGGHPEKPGGIRAPHLDGVADIARVVDSKIADQVLSAAILRLPEEGPRRTSGSEPSWYIGQLSAELLAIVVEISDRDAIEACVSRVCASLREPVSIGDAAFQLTPYAGVSILGQDGTTPQQSPRQGPLGGRGGRRCELGQDSVLHGHTEAALHGPPRRRRARFATRSPSREIRLRYVGRYELADRPVWWRRWVTCDGPSVARRNPAAEFLGIAETTGLATLLSRALLERSARRILPRWHPSCPPDARLSFGRPESSPAAG